MNEIIIYSKDYCPFCVKAKSLLQSKKQDFTEFNIQQDANKLAEMLEISNNARTVPQIVINGKHIGGCDDLYELNEQGKLDSILGL